jgi:hypothetical protein
LIYLLAFLLLTSLPIAIMISIQLANKYQNLMTALQTLPNRLTVLFGLFLMVDLISVCLVFSRNI